MITLTNGHFQGPDGAPLVNGSISFQLNLDATIIAAPGGFVPGSDVVYFQLDSSGNIQIGAKIYSNLELNPQNSRGLGTYYLVTVYDANGARVNAVPMVWQFQEGTGSTVDISHMTAANIISGAIIYYPFPISGSGTVTSVGMVGDGTIFDSSVAGSPIITAGVLQQQLSLQTAHTVLVGPNSGSPAAPTFRLLTSADLPAGTGSVTSVAMTGDGVVFNSSVTGSPITTSGTLAPSLHTQSANAFLAGPTSGGAVAPTFRAMVVADLPTTGTWAFAGTMSGSYTMSGTETVSGTLTSSGGTLSGSWAGSPTLSGNPTFSGTPVFNNVPTFPNQTAHFVFAGPTSGGAATPAFRALISSDLPAGTGTLTSVAMTGDGVIFNTTVGGSPITTSGTLIPALLTQTANFFLAGPTTGSAATPTFRAMVIADLPTTGTWVFTGTMSGSYTMSSTETVSGTLASSGGTISGSWAGNPTFSGTVVFSNVPTLPNQSANVIFAGPTSGGAAAPGFRAMVVADLPTTGSWPFTGTLSAAFTISNTATVSGTIASSGGTLSGSWAGNPVFTGNPQFSGQILDGTASHGSSQQVLSSTGTGVQWVASSTLPSLPDQVEVNGVVVTSCNISVLVNGVAPVGVAEVNGAVVKQNVPSMWELCGTVGTGGGPIPNQVFTSHLGMGAITRAFSTLYQNNCGFPVMVVFSVQPNSASSLTYSCQVGSTVALGTTVANFVASSNTGGNPTGGAFIVMPGQYYKIVPSNTSTLNSWREFALCNGTLTDSGDIHGSKALATTYQNTTTGTLFVLVQTTIAANTVVQGITDPTPSPATVIDDALQSSSGSATTTTVLVVPPGNYYKILASGGSLVSWHEYSWSIGCSRSVNVAGNSRFYGSSSVFVNNASVATGVYHYLNSTQGVPKVRWIAAISVNNTNSGNNCQMLAWDARDLGGIMQGGTASTGKSRRLFGPIMPNYFYAMYEIGSGTVVLNSWYEYTFD